MINKPCSRCGVSCWYGDGCEVHEKCVSCRHMLTMKKTGYRIVQVDHEAMAKAEREGEAFRAIMQEQMDRRLEYLQTTLATGGLRITGMPEQPTLSARLGHLKHGPGGSGLSGPCDADCAKCQAERNAKPSTVEPWMKVDGPPPDPLDVKYDGVKLRELLRLNDCNARNDGPRIQVIPFTSAQRAAVSAHWSAELRAKIATAKERDRNLVTMENDE